MRKMWQIVSRSFAFNEINYAKTTITSSLSVVFCSVYDSLKRKPSMDSVFLFTSTIGNELIL